MGKTNQFIKALSVSTIILISNTAIVSAQNASDLEIDQEENVSDFIEEEESSDESSELKCDLPHYVETIEKSSQSANSDSSLDVLNPAQKPISDKELKQLNSESNLSLPENVNEVKVGAPKPITLRQAIEVTFANNKDLETARLQVEQAQAGLRQAKAAIFPTLDIGSALTLSDAAFLDSTNDQLIDLAVENNGITEEEAIAQREANLEFSGGNFTDRNLTFTSNIALNYNFFDGGNRGATIKSAEKSLERSEKEFKLTCSRIISGDANIFDFSGTAQEYFSLQDADSQVRVAKAAVEDAQLTLKDAQQLEKAGLGTRFDVLRAEVELAQAQQNENNAVAAQNIARRELAEIMSIPHDSDVSAAEPIKKLDDWKDSLELTIINALKDNDELEQLKLDREIAEQQRKQALSQVRPTVGASAQYQVSDDLEGDNLDLTDQYSLGLNFQWSLFDGGSARAGARQAEKNIEIAEAQFADERNEIREGTEEAFFNLESTRNNIDTATKEVELAEESLRLARLRFQAGVGTQTDVIEAQTQLTTARGNYFSSIVDYNQAYIGFPDPDDISSKSNSEESDELEFNSDDLDSDTSESN